MIDWDKPIETVDGRGAKIIARLPNAADAPTMVWIESDRNGFGDVFLVNNEGVRCDDRAIYSKRQEPLIRNVRVKREGWGRVKSNNGLPFTIGHIVFSEKASAEAACQMLGGIPAFITWEE